MSSFIMIYSNTLKLLLTTDPNIVSCWEFEKIVLAKFWSGIVHLFHEKKKELI